MRNRHIQALYYRGCLTIRNLNKNKPRWGVISKNKQPILQNIRLWDSLHSAGFGDFRGTEDDLMDFSSKSKT